MPEDVQESLSGKTQENPESNQNSFDQQEGASGEVQATHPQPAMPVKANLPPSGQETEVLGEKKESFENSTKPETFTKGAGQKKVLTGGLILMATSLLLVAAHFLLGLF